MAHLSFVGGQIAKAPPRLTLLLTVLAIDQENGARDRAAPLVVHERSDGEVGHGLTGAGEDYLLERTIVTLVHHQHNKMMITRQSTRALTVSSRMSRRTCGGSGASMPQAVKSLPF